MPANSNMQYRIESAVDRTRTLPDEIGKLGIESKVICSLDHMPANLVDELRRAAKLWPSRIVVMREAYASAEAFRGNDLDEQWQILSAVANALWGLYFKEDSADIAEDFKARAGFELALTEKKLTKRNGAFIRQRERTYHGRTIDITPHIKGKDKNPKFAFRLHYWANEDEKLIVIGHCSEHLTTTGTQKLR